MITENNHTANPYKAISHFFEAFDLLSARDYIQTSLLAANSKKLWKGQCPAGLVAFYEDYKKLFTAAATITGSGCKRQTGIVAMKEGRPAAALTGFSLYCKPCDAAEHWLYMPRCLSVKEFCNPYKALKKAVRFIQQDKFDAPFDKVIQYALSYDSFRDACIDWDTLQLNIMLQKLLEAAHLLYVRTAIASNATVTDNDEAE